MACYQNPNVCNAKLKRIYDSTHFCEYMPARKIEENICQHANSRRERGMLQHILLNNSQRF